MNLPALSTAETSRLFPSPNLFERLDANYLSWFRGAAAIPGCELVETDRYELLTTPYNFPLYNCVLRTRVDDDNATATAKEIDARFATNGLAYRYYLGPSTPRQEVVLGALAERGKAQVVRYPGVWAHIGPRAEEIRRRLADDKVETRRVCDAATRDDWTAVLGAGFGIAAEHLGFFRDYIDAHAFGAGAPFLCFVSYDRGTPVAVAGAYLAEGVAGLYCVTTTPGARRLGHASSVTVRTVWEVLQRGYTGIGGYASPMGLEVYQSLGAKTFASVAEVY